MRLKPHTYLSQEHLPTDPLISLSGAFAQQTDRISLSGASSQQTLQTYTYLSRACLPLRLTGSHSAPDLAAWMARCCTSGHFLAPGMRFYTPDCPEPQDGWAT